MARLQKSAETATRKTAASGKAAVFVQMPEQWPHLLTPPAPHLLTLAASWAYAGAGRTRDAAAAGLGAAGCCAPPRGPTPRFPPAAHECALARVAEPLSSLSVWWCSCVSAACPQTQPTHGRLLRLLRHVAARADPGAVASIRQRLECNCHGGIPCVAFRLSVDDALSTMLC